MTVTLSGDLHTERATADALRALQLAVIARTSLFARATACYTPHTQFSLDERRTNPNIITHRETSLEN